LQNSKQYHKLPFLISFLSPPIIEIGVKPF
jgi:hypothetical protein